MSFSETADPARAQRASWNAALAGLAEALAPPTSRTDTLRALADGARLLSGAAAVAVVDVDGGPRVDVALDAAGDHLDDAAGLPSVVAGALARLTTDQPEVLASRPPAGLACYPLRAVPRYNGALLVAERPQPERPEVRWRERIEDFLDHGARLTSGTATTEDVPAAVIAAERHRIARDLHDIVIQRIYTVGMSLRAATVHGEAAEMASSVSDAVAELEGVIDDLRTSIFDLERSSSTSLRAAVLDLVGEYTPPLGFRPRVEFSGEVSTGLDEPVTRQVLVVLREALSNCVRHAHATSVTVSVSVHLGWCTVAVLDDGAGPPGRPDTSRDHLGLANLAQRAEDLGGQMEFGPASGSGSLLRWRVPTAHGSRPT